MKKKILNFLKYIIAFFILMFVFNFLLYITCSFDSKMIKENVKSSSTFLSNQGSFYKISNLFNVWNNNYTEAVIINEAYSVDYHKPFVSYMKARKDYDSSNNKGEYEENTGEGVSINYDSELNEEIYSENYDSIGELADFLSGKIHYSIPYGRYWHGYLVLYRPLLLLFDIHQIKVFQLISFAILYLLFVFLLYKRFGKSIALIFGVSLICSGYFSASYSLESAPVFFVMIISSILLVKRIDKIKRFGIFIFVVGCLTNYVDYLTVPLITIGMLCAIYLMKEMEERKDWKYCLKFLITNSIIWLIGYAGAWIFKWLLYDLTINDQNNMLKIGFTQSFYRMNRTNATAGDSSYIYTIINILGPESLYLIIVSGILLWINKFKVIANKFNKNIFSFWLLSLYPIVWYGVLANHTLLHYYFTYRQSLVFMIGILLGFYYLLFEEEKS